MLAWAKQAFRRVPAPILVLMLVIWVQLLRACLTTPSVFSLAVAAVLVVLIFAALWSIGAQGKAIVSWLTGAARSPKDPAACQDLRSALSDSEQVVAGYKQFLAGETAWNDLVSKLVPIGNAWEGAVGPGDKAPQAVKEAIEEVEAFDFGEEGSQMLKLTWVAISADQAELQRAKAEIEIQRQEHFNDVIRRKMRENNC